MRFDKLQVGSWFKQGGRSYIKTLTHIYPVSGRANSVDLTTGYSKYIEFDEEVAISVIQQTKEKKK